MGRPSKASPELWAKARAMYEANKSFRTISTELDICISSLQNKVKTEGWKRDVLTQIIDDSVKVQEVFSTLVPEQQEVVSKEVDKKLGFIKKRDSIANIAYNKIKEALNVIDPLNPYAIKPLVEATDKLGVIVEIAPRHPTQASPVQNNIGFNFNLEDRDQNMQRLKKLIAGNIIDA